MGQVWGWVPLNLVKTPVAFTTYRYWAVILSIPYICVFTMVMCVFHVLHFQNVKYPYSPSLFSLWTCCVCCEMLVVYVVSPARSSIHFLIIIKTRTTVEAGTTGALTLLSSYFLLFQSNRGSCDVQSSVFSLHLHYLLPQEHITSILLTLNFDLLVLKWLKYEEKTHINCATRH